MATFFNVTINLNLQLLLKHNTQASQKIYNKGTIIIFNNIFTPIVSMPLGFLSQYFCVRDVLDQSQTYAHTPNPNGHLGTYFSGLSN